MAHIALFRTDTNKKSRALGPALMEVCGKLQFNCFYFAALAVGGGNLHLHFGTF